MTVEQEHMWAEEARRLGMPVDAWLRGKRAAAEGVEVMWQWETTGHILAASPGPPWVEPPHPPRAHQRKAMLHGGPYDRASVDVYALGQHLTVGGEHGSALYELKEWDDVSATYTAVEDDADVSALTVEPAPALAAAVELEPAEALF